MCFFAAGGPLEVRAFDDAVTGAVDWRATMHETGGNETHDILSANARWNANVTFW